MARRVGLLAAAALLWAAPALSFTAHLITDQSFVNKTPGTDLRVGTGDDETISGPVGFAQSSPNVHGAASFALLNFPTSGMPDYSNFDFLLFVDGTIEFTPNFSASTADDLVVDITGGQLRSTDEFNYPARGEATTTLTGGTAHFDPMTGSGTVTMTGTFAPATAASFPLTDQTLTAAPGNAWIVLPSSFGNTGNAYLDNVLAPLLPSNATALLLVEFTGTVSGTACCDGRITHGVIAAYTTDDLGCPDLFSQFCGASTTTTTTLPPGGCAGIVTCQTSLGSALPDPANAANRKAKRMAKKLARRFVKIEKVLGAAAKATGKKQRRRYRKARRRLRALLRLARKADRKGRLGVPLAPIEAAINGLIASLPI